MVSSDVGAILVLLKRGRYATCWEAVLHYPGDKKEVRVKTAEEVKKILRQNRGKQFVLRTEQPKGFPLGPEKPRRGPKDVVCGIECTDKKKRKEVLLDQLDELRN